jgi:DNA-3-methyladenine glycosylase
MVYVYLIYGVHYMLNFVTAVEGEPQAVLIRGVENAPGPGRVSKLLQVDKTFYAEDLYTSTRIWVEDKHEPAPKITTGKRIGIDYAGAWKNKPWRFMTAAHIGS